MSNEAAVVTIVGYWCERSTKAKAVICLTSRELADKSSIKGDLLGRNNNRRLCLEKSGGSFYRWI